MSYTVIAMENKRYDITDPEARKGVKVYLTGITSGDFEVRRHPLKAVREAHAKIHWLANYELYKLKENANLDYTIKIEVHPDYAEAYEKSEYVILQEKAVNFGLLHKAQKGGVSVNQKSLDPSVGMK